MNNGHRYDEAEFSIANELFSYPRLGAGHHLVARRRSKFLEPVFGQEQTHPICSMSKPSSNSHIYWIFGGFVGFTCTASAPRLPS